MQPQPARLLAESLQLGPESFLFRSLGKWSTRYDALHRGFDLSIGFGLSVLFGLSLEKY